MMRFPRRRFWLIGLLLASSQIALRSAEAHFAPEVDERFAETGAEARFAQILKLVKKSNAPKLVGPERWDELVVSHRDRILRAESHSEFARAVNKLIKASGISHFKYYTDQDFAYWHARSAFGGGEESHVAHIGLFPQKIEGRWFVRGVLEGSPASESNIKIRVGDEIVSVDDRPYRNFAAFVGKAGQATTVVFRRSAALTYSVRITPRRGSLHESLQRAIRKSIRVSKTDGRSVLYMHGWTMLGGREYRRLLEMQDEVDGLLLDFRDGYGGTWHAASSFLLGKGEGDDGGASRWNKPVVILTGDGTRSAKEIVVDAVKRAGAAPLVGLPTPGHVISVGGLRRTGGDGLLMLPGMRFELEGKPTQPDILVERDIRYCGGDDQQMHVAELLLTALMDAHGSATLESSH